MRKMVIVFVVLLLCVVEASAQQVNFPGAKDNTQVTAEASAFANASLFVPIKNVGINAQKQEMKQGQIGINVNAPYNDQKIKQVVDQEFNVPRQFIEAIPQMVNPQINPLITGGIGSAKDILPNFAGLKWLENEEIIGVVSYNGWFMDRICMEDLEEFILKNKDAAAAKLETNIANVRLRVLFKPKSKGIGVGGQANLLTSYLPSPGASQAGSMAGGGAGIAGYNSSWIDNTYTVKFYKVK